MVKVTLVYTRSCPFCPAVKKFWQDLQKGFNFEYEEIDALSKKGKELVAKHSITNVPTTIIDDKIAFVGFPEREKAIAAIKGE